MKDCWKTLAVKFFVFVERKVSKCICVRERDWVSACVGRRGDLKPMLFVPAGVSGLDSWALMGSLRNLF